MWTLSSLLITPFRSLFNELRRCLRFFLSHLTTHSLLTFFLSLLADLAALSPDSVVLDLSSVELALVSIESAILEVQ